MDAVRYDWDETNTSHIALHRIAPQEVEQVLNNDPADIDFDVIHGEERFTALGHTDSLRILYVVWTLRNDIVRPVTAYVAPKRTATRYLKTKGLL